MTSFSRQLAALLLVTGAAAIYIGIGALQHGGIVTYWGRLPPLGAPLVVVSEPYASDAAETPSAPRATPVPASPAAPTHAAAVLAALNAQRAAEGLAPLAADAVLAVPAQAHAADMAVRGYFDHTTPDGMGFAERMAAAGVSAPRMAENIGLTSYDDPSRVIASWMDSPAHRQNVLGAFSGVGIGIAAGPWQGLNAFFVVAIFSSAR